MRGPSLAPVLRLSLLYLSLFGALGLMGPLAPLVFEARGLSAGSIAILVTLGACARVSAPPLSGSVADRVGLRRVLVLAGLGGSAAALGLGFWSDTALAGVLYVVYVGFAAVQVPLADVLTHGALAPRSERFAWVRVWGSVGFVLAVAAAGRLELTVRPMLMFGTVAACHLATVACALATPAEPRSVVGARSGMGASLRAAREAGLGIFLAATTLHYFGFGVYDAYFALRLRALGFDDGFIGVAIAVGVVAEIGLMLFAPRIVARAGPGGVRKLAFVGAAAAGLRWAVLGLAEAPALVLAVQPLHALGFGLWYLAVVAHVQARAPEGLRATVQGAAVAAIGLGSLLGSGIGGLLVARFGPGAAFGLAALTASLAAGLYLGPARAALTGRGAGREPPLGRTARSSA